MCKKLICLVVLLSLFAWETSASADLVGRWPLNGNPTDVSGNRHDGVVEGDVIYGEGIFGLAADFNGSNALINCGNVPVLGGGSAISIAFWVKPRNIAQNWAGFVSKWTLDNANRTFWLGQHSTDGWLRFSIYPGGPTAETALDSGRVILRNEEWTHIVCTYDGNIQRIYADGAEVVASPSRNAAITDRGGNLRFGKVAAANWLNGLIDDVHIYSHALTEAEIQAVIRGAVGLASEPNPTDGATDIPRDIALGWTPGEFAATHDVYFGTVFADVNNAGRANPIGVLASQGHVAATYDPPGRLDFGQTYYWRIDEVNAPPASTIFKGDVWSFTVEPLAYQINADRITATASSTNRADEGPANTINGSGLDADDLHSSGNPDMWLSDISGPQPTWIQYEFDKAYKLHQMWVWNYNSSTEPVIGFGVKEATIEYSTGGANWTALGATHEFARGPGAAGYATNTTIDLGGAAAKYVRITANSNWGGILAQYGLSEVRFSYIPVSAREPNPVSGATGVAVDTTLGWRPGREAARHNVYLSTDEQAVIDGTAPMVTVTSPSYATSLNLASTYYWRVDEVNDVETPKAWQGDIWSLSTQEYLVVDDFESYNDIPSGQEGSNLVYETWADGFANPATNGSTIGYTEAFQPSMEKIVIFDGKQSVPLFYNTAASISEIRANVANLQAGKDWSKYGIKGLTLRFYGDPNNVPQQMYAKVNGVKVTYGGNAGNLTLKGWQMWYIDLASLGVNLSNVSTLTIGLERIGGVGSQGKVLLDGIRLYSYDRQLVTPTIPGTTNLVGYWTFDEGTGTTAADSSGKKNNGTITGAQWVAGKVGGALSFDGVDDFVDLGNPPNLPSGASARSICAWAMTNTLSTGWKVVVGYGSPAASQAFGFAQNGGVLSGFGFGNDLLVNNFWQTGLWYHLCLTYDGTTATLYADGVQLLSGAKALNLVLSRARIGRQVNDAAEFWNGLIDDVRLYDRALTQEEVAGLAGVTVPFDKPF